MKLIPCDQFSIITNKPLPEVVAILAEQIEPEVESLADSQGAPLMGEISKSRFRVNRILIDRQDSLFIYIAAESPLIYIHGDFYDSAHGTTVSIRQKLNIRFIVTISWVIFMLAMLMISSFVTLSSLILLLIIPIVCVFVFELFVLLCFWESAYSNQRLFYQIIHNVEIAPPQSRRRFRKKVRNTLKWLGFTTVGLSLAFALLVISQKLPSNLPSISQPSQYCNQTTPLSNCESFGFSP
ncbi:MAG: hypothetical protein AAGG51_24250 [Cyanobacteria bacterium P01_G01_bin.54]